MANRKFKSIEDYFDYINKILEECVKEIGVQMKTELQDYLFENWYKKYTPSEYIRSFNLLDSVKYSLIKQNGKIIVKVYYDENSIIPEYMEDSYWNRHMSLSGEDVSNDVPYYIEYGNGDNKLFKYNGIHAMKSLLRYAEQTATIKLAILLNTKYGISIK